MKNNITKKRQFSEIIEKLKHQKTYFSYEEIKVLIEKEKINITPALLKVYVFELTKNGVIYDAGKGWYSSIKEPFELNTRPVQEIIYKIKKELPLLEFACWSTEQLNSFTHHVLAKFITFVYTDSDYMHNLSELLRNNGYNVYENPNKAEIEKLFTMKDQTVVVRSSISKQPITADYYSPIEKILVDFLIENGKIGIMENTEAEAVVKNALNSGRINISEFHSYAKRRTVSLPAFTNQVQQKINLEIVSR